MRYAVSRQVSRKELPAEVSPTDQAYRGMGSEDKTYQRKWSQQIRLTETSGINIPEMDTTNLPADAGSCTRSMTAAQRRNTSDNPFLDTSTAQHSTPQHQRVTTAQTAAPAAVPSRLPRPASHWGSRSAARTAVDRAVPLASRSAACDQAAGAAETGCRLWGDETRTEPGSGRVVDRAEQCSRSGEPQVGAIPSRWVRAGARPR